MSQIPARYEFRVWAQNLGEIRARLERHATPLKAVSRETYFVSRTTDRCNAKIRSELMDIKMLLDEHRGLERWRPVLKAGFPLERSVIAGQIFPCLELTPPGLGRAQYELAEFVDEVVRPEPGIAIAHVSKTRFQFNLEDSQAEFAAVTVNDVPQDTVAMESANPDAVLRLIHDFGLEQMPNLSYVRQVKRMLGFGPS